VKKPIVYIGDFGLEELEEDQREWELIKKAFKEVKKDEVQKK